MGNALQFTKEDIAGAVWLLEHQRRVQFEGCVAEPLKTTTAILPGSKSSCLLLRVALQDALSEVTKIYPLLKLRVFVDDITALKGVNREVAEAAKKVTKKLKEELEKKSLKLSVTENGKKGKSKMIASCGFLEDELRRIHRVALDWLFDRINLDPKIQIKYIDTKNQLADILTRRNFTRDEWNHLLCLFNISHFSSTNCSEVMSKRTQEDSGEERVTAKSKPMMNLVSRYRVRDPNVLASTASDKPQNTKSESLNVPLSSLNVQQTSTGRPVYDKFVIDDDMDSDTATESNLSLRSRSFLNRVNDRLRKMLDLSPEDAMRDIDKRSMIWRMFMCSTLEASVFVGKHYSDNLHAIKNTWKNLTFKQMFAISEKLIVGQIR